MLESFFFLLVSVHGRFVLFPAELISLLADNYMDRSTAFKNSTTFIIISSSEDTVFSQAVRALIPNSFAWKEQNEISETNYINHIKISYKRRSTRALFAHEMQSKRMTSYAFRHSDRSTEQGSFHIRDIFVRILSATGRWNRLRTIRETDFQDHTKLLSCSNSEIVRTIASFSRRTLLWVCL